MDPYQSVKVNFDNNDYINVCVQYGGGYALLHAWRALGDLLAGRPGWHFDVVNDGEALWSLGLLGESRLNIRVTEDGGYHCYDYGADHAVVIYGIAAVELWLADREDEAKLPSATLLALARGDDWSVFKHHQFKMTVSWSDDYFSASLPHHLDSAFGSALPEAVLGAAQLPCRLFDAPLVARHATLVG